MSGQVLRLNGEPLANVTFSLGGAETRSDRTGRFLLKGTPTGRQGLLMDGSTAKDPIGLQAGETNFYAYVGSNPLRFIDPLGLDKEGPFEEPGLGTPWLDPIDLIGGVGGLTTKLIGKVAAKQASKAVAHSSLRRVGDILESVDDIVANPELIRGLTPTDVVARLGRLPARWTVGTLGRGSRAGQGWVLREANTAGNLTGRAIFWHPGAGHHGAGAYWKVSSPQGGIVRVFK